MNVGNLYERTAVRIKHDLCSFNIAAKFPSSLVQVPFVKFRQSEDYSEQFRPYFEPLTLAWPGCAYLNLSVLTLSTISLSIFDFACLHFHYN